MTTFALIRPWLETLGGLVLAGAACVVGRLFSRLRRPYWAAGYAAPLLVIAAVAAVRWAPALEFIPPFSWLLAGRIEFAASAAAGAMLFATLLPHLPRREMKILVGILMAVIVLRYAVLPFALPGLLRGSLSALETKFDPDGVCQQSTGYTCGPAAAVSALDQLGLPGDEAELAVLARTNPVSGTQPDLLCAALAERYAARGLSCEYRYFASVAELRDAAPAIAMIRHSILTDHYVAVLKVDDLRVTLADPQVGLRKLSDEHFARIWRNCAIVLSLPGAGPE